MRLTIKGRHFYWDGCNSLTGLFHINSKKPKREIKLGRPWWEAVLVTTKHRLWHSVNVTYAGRACVMSWFIEWQNIFLVCTTCLCNQWFRYTRKNIAFKAYLDLFHAVKHRNMRVVCICTYMTKASGMKNCLCLSRTDSYWHNKTS